MNGLTSFLIIFKILSLLIFILVTNHNFLPRISILIHENDSYTKAVIFILLWIFSLAFLLIASFQPKFQHRLLWATLFTLSTGVGYGFYLAGGSEIEVLDVLSLWQARHEAGRAFEFFQDAMIKAIMIMFIGFLIILLPINIASDKTRILIEKLKWTPVLPFLIFITIIFVKSDRAVTALPQQFVPISIISVVSYKLATHHEIERANVTQTPTNKPAFRHIIYLVDESVNPKFLYKTPNLLLNGLEFNRDKIADFGIAVSGGNCSARSNAILRLGATRHNIINDIQKSPTVWQFAKKAGFRTAYFDAQSTSIQPITKPGDFQNYMNTTETRFVDKFVKIKDVDPSMADFRLIELIKNELDSDKPTFIFANKQGVHFPYHKNYPDSETIYRPITKTLDVKSEASKAGLINAYKNSINWSVDVFFQKFFDEIDLSDAVVFYTSDHGQNLAQPRQPQCSTAERASPVEGMVPMLLISDKKEAISEFKQAAKKNFNRIDHFSLMPTYLGFLGYSSDVQDYYGKGLLESGHSETASFNTGDIMGVISNDTIWTEVTMEQRTKLLSDRSTEDQNKSLYLNSKVERSILTVH